MGDTYNTSIKGMYGPRTNAQGLSSSQQASYHRQLDSTLRDRGCYANNPNGFNSPSLVNRVNAISAEVRSNVTRTRI